MSTHTRAQRLMIYPLSLALITSMGFTLGACDDTNTPTTSGGASTAGTAEVPLGGATSGGTMTGGAMTAGVMTGGMMTGGAVMGGAMTGGAMTGGTNTRPMICTPGALGVCLSETEGSVCNAEGSDYVSAPCDEGQFCLNGACGDMRCVPGDTRCSPSEPDLVLECDPSGLEWVNATFCGRNDACRNGECVSGCEAAAKLNTYIGCEYWTVDLDNYPDPFSTPMPNEVPHSVVISNPSDLPAEVSFETRSGAMVSVSDPMVPAGEVRAFTMPRLDVDNTGITFNSIKVSSTMPVIAYQFNPLNNAGVASNDASLLLPTNTLGADYLVSSWPTGPNLENIFPSGIIPQAGYFTVVATSPGETEVTVTVTAATEPSAMGLMPEVPAMEAGETRSFRLQQFQVLNLQAAAFTPADFAELLTAPNTDLTGSRVSASQPVAVFGGHEEAVVSAMNSQEDSCCADHLEEQLLPLQTWSDESLCVKAKPRGGSSEIDVWRVMSGVDGNTISTTPSVAGLDGVTLNTGEWVQVETPLSFKLTGTGPVQATQYLLSQGQTEEGDGDPSMILAVPTEQLRESYNILVPMDYGDDWVTVTRPVGVEVLLDGTAITEPFTALGDGVWEYAYVPVAPGSHSLSSAVPFALIAYGWNNAVSYGYPAGLNLRSATERGR